MTVESKSNFVSTPLKTNKQKCLLLNKFQFCFKINVIYPSSF